MREFYAMYGETIEIVTPLRKEKDMHKQPKLETVLVWDALIEIWEKDISKYLFGDLFEPVTATLEYNYQMIELKRLRC